MRISRHPSSRFMRFPSMNGTFDYQSRRESRLDSGLDLQHDIVLYGFVEEPVSRAVVTIAVSTMFARVFARFAVPPFVIPVAAFVFLFLATGHEETDEQQKGYKYSFHKIALDSSGRSLSGPPRDQPREEALFRHGSVSEPV